MKRLLNLSEHLESLRQLGVWILLAIPAGLLAGTASAFFLWALERVTDLRFEHGWLLFLLPVGGLLVGLAYHYHPRANPSTGRRRAGTDGAAGINRHTGDASVRRFSRTRRHGHPNGRQSGRVVWKDS